MRSRRIVAAKRFSGAWSATDILGTPDWMGYVSLAFTGGRERSMRDGVRRTIVDEQATKEQREALIALDSGQHGGPYWEIFAAVCPNLREAVFPPVTLNVDPEKRLATIQIPVIGETKIDPIKQPVPARQPRARIPMTPAHDYHARLNAN